MSDRLYINNLTNGGYHIGYIVGNVGLYDRTVPRNEFGNITSMLEIFVNAGVTVNRKVLEDILTECYTKISHLEPKKVYEETGTNGRIEFIYEPGFGNNINNLLDHLNDALDILIRKGKYIEII
jgi:hypothetical protein